MNYYFDGTNECVVVNYRLLHASLVVDRGGGGGGGGVFGVLGSGDPIACLIPHYLVVWERPHT